jgi:hypothetical protein
MSQYVTEFEFLDNTITVTADYTYNKGYAESGPSYASGGEPAESPSIEIFSIKCELAIYNKVDKKTTYRPIEMSKDCIALIEDWLQNECFDDMCESAD